MKALCKFRGMLVIAEVTIDFDRPAEEIIEHSGWIEFYNSDGEQSFAINKADYNKAVKNIKRKC